MPTAKNNRHSRKFRASGKTLLFLLILVQLARISTSCPCRYCGPTTLCHQMNLQEVPYTIPTSEVVRLLLYGNHITVLTAGEFRGMSRLKELDLHANKISKVESLAFDGLDNLESLHLSSNEIEYLPHGALRRMPKLTRLFLDHNKLTKLPADVPYLSELSKFNVEQNQIRTIVWSSFYTLRKLESAILWNNPLQCDCDTRELITWFQKTPRGLTINTDSILLDCKEENTNQTCSHSRVKEVIHLPSVNGAHVDITNNKGRTVAVYVQSDDARLHCDVTGKPFPLISWKTPSAGYVYPYTENRLTSYVNGTLVVRDLRTSDSGKYSCHPRRAEGPVAASEEIEIVVVRGVKPEVKASQEKVEGDSSGDVTLQCQVKGNPHPDVQWYSPQSNNLPLTRANFTEIAQEGFKFRQSNNGTELTIFNLSEQDTGLWKCRASNSMGFDAAFITVALLQSEDNLILIIIIIACSVLVVVIVAVVIVTCFVTKRRRNQQQGGERRKRKAKSGSHDKVEEVHNQNSVNPGAGFNIDDVIAVTSSNRKSLPEILPQPFTTEPEVKGIRF